jgi:hypothetical protein
VYTERIIVENEGMKKNISLLHKKL